VERHASDRQLRRCAKFGGGQDIKLPTHNSIPETLAETPFTILGHERGDLERSLPYHSISKFFDVKWFVVTITETDANSLTSVTNGDK
jgi:hypothetical protein